MKWTGIRQEPAIRAWSSNPEADECFARMLRAKDETERQAWARRLEGAQMKAAAPHRPRGMTPHNGTTEA